MSYRKRKATIDDGMNPELVKGATFDGIFEIPIIEKPRKLLIPSGITPFSIAQRTNLYNEAIGFFEKDINFSEVLIAPQNYIDEFSRAMAIITPDCSLYRDAPLIVQLTNIYRNRAIGYYYQHRGLYVIPQIRWGSEATFTTEVLPEKVAFSGVEKHSIVAIGPYGCVSSRDDKYYFREGLEAMLDTLEPEIVLVYGAKSHKIFEKYEHVTRFVYYPDWTTRKKGGV